MAESKKTANQKALESMSEEEFEILRACLQGAFSKHGVITLKKGQLDTIREKCMAMAQNVGLERGGQIIELAEAQRKLDINKEAAREEIRQKHLA